MTRLMKSLIAVIFIFSFTNLFAQRPENSVYMAGGLSFQTATADPINYIISRYNETQPNLLKKMDEASRMSGASFSFGFGMGEEASFLQFEIGLTLHGSGALESEIDVTNGPDKHFDLKLSAYYINTGFAYLIQNENKFEYGAGLYIDYGGIRVRKRQYNAGQASNTFTDIGEVQKLLAFTPTIYLNYNFSKQFGVTLRPYYRAQIVENDFGYVSESINPSSYRNDDPEKTKGVVLSGFGAELKAVFYF